ncbi:MAG: hypothetical protein WBB35_14495 [Saprospiraceae bacterium]
MKSKKHLQPDPASSIMPSRKWKWFVIILALVVNLDTIRYDFTLDDPLVITGNAFVQEGWKSIPRIFSTVNLEGYSGEKESNYRPLSISQFAIEKSIFGLNPTGFHLLHILYYSLVCMLVFVFLTLILRGVDPWIPFVITILYTIHPIHVEVVANLKSRDEIMGMIGILSSLILILRPTNSLMSRLALGLTACVAFFSKESALPLILVAPLTLYFFREKSIRQIVSDSAPIWIAAILYLFMRQVIARTPGPNFTLEENALFYFSAPERWFAALALIGHYIQLMLFPLTLRADYSFDQLHLRGWSDPWAYAGLLILTIAVYMVVRGFKSKSMWSYALIFAGLFYSVTANILVMTGATLAERFMFVPSLALMILFVYAVQSLSNKLALSRKVMFGICGVFGLFWVIKTLDRNPDWKTNDLIYEVSVRDSPQSIRTMTKMARSKYNQALDPMNQASKEALLAESQSLLDKSIGLYDGYGLSHLLKGLILRLRNDYPGAIKQLTIASTSRPEAATAHLQLGITYRMMQNDASAAGEFEIAESKGLKSTLLYHEMATLYIDTNQPLKAVEYYKKLIDLDPTDKNTLSQLVKIYRDQLKDMEHARFYNEKLKKLLDAK